MLNQEIYDELVAKFEKMYGKKPEIVAYAPGRIEVLGNHTDYNEGYVFSAAIDKGTFFAVSPTADDSCELTAGDFMETAKFTTSTVAPAKEMTWQNYVTGTFNWLFDGNPAAAKHGWKAMFLGNIPLGAGLSSSAALEMCTVLALSKLYGIEKDKTTLAKIGQGLPLRASRPGVFDVRQGRRARQERLPHERVRVRSDGRRRRVHDGQV